MVKPTGYDEVQAGGFTPVELGGHHLVIMAVKEQQSSTGKPMLVVAFDLAKNDKQAGYFAKQFDEDVRPDKKWPNNATKYIMTQDYNDSSKVSRDFKSFCTSFERSNNTTVEWGEKFCEQFKGKKIGGVFGEVENEYEGKTSMRHQLRWFCDDDKVNVQKIPETKYLANKPSGNTADKFGFLNIPVETEGEIPF